MDCYLDQHVHSPTRGNNILDLVLTSELEPKGEVIVMAPVDNSDHNVLVWEMNCNINVSLSNRIKLLYNQADYEAMRHFVKGRLANLDSTYMSASTKWDNFNCIMQDAINVLFQFAPVLIREINLYG